MQKKAVGIYSIDTLAQMADVSRRTIHYYSQRGLLMPPEGEGRGSHYTGRHLKRLHELRKLASQGVPLSKIKEYFDHGPAVHGAVLRDVPMASSAPSEMTATGWSRFALSEGVELHVRAGALTETQQERIMRAISDTIRTRPTQI